VSAHSHRHITLRAGDSANEREREEGGETKKGGRKEGSKSKAFCKYDENYPNWKFRTKNF
jgi:hypothetical protein